MFKTFRTTLPALLIGATSILLPFLGSSGVTAGPYQSALSDSMLAAPASPTCNAHTCAQHTGTRKAYCANLNMATDCHLFETSTGGEGCNSPSC